MMIDQANNNNRSSVHKEFKTRMFKGSIVSSCSGRSPIKGFDKFFLSERQHLSSLNVHLQGGANTQGAVEHNIQKISGSWASVRS